MTYGPEDTTPATTFRDYFTSETKGTADDENDGFGKKSSRCVRVKTPPCVYAPCVIEKIKLEIRMCCATAAVRLIRYFVIMEAWKPRGVLSACRMLTNGVWRRHPGSRRKALALNSYSFVGWSRLQG